MADGSRQAARTADPETARITGGEWRTHGPLVAVSALGVSLCITHLYSMGAFITPLSQAFGWNRGQVTSGLVLVSALSFFCAPLVGLLIDRVGPRWIGIPGAAAYCAALALLATQQGSLWQWWLSWLLLAVAVQFVKSNVWIYAVAGSFMASRGLAIALVLSGGGLSSTLNPVLATALIDQAGWRWAYLGLAAFWAVVTIPLCLLFFSDPRKTAAPRRPDAGPAPASRPKGMAVLAALRSPAFLKLAACALLIDTVAAGLSVHLMPMVTDAGLGRAAAASLASIMGVSSIVGRLTTGWMFDRFNGPAVGAMIFLMPAAACGLLLGYRGGYLAGAVIAGIIGYAFGSATDVMAYLSSRYFVGSPGTELEFAL